MTKYRFVFYELSHEMMLWWWRLISTVMSIIIYNESSFWVIHTKGAFQESQQDANEKKHIDVLRSRIKWTCSHSVLYFLCCLFKSFAKWISMTLWREMLWLNEMCFYGKTLFHSNTETLAQNSSHRETDYYRIWSFKSAIIPSQCFHSDTVVVLFINCKICCGFNSIFHASQNVKSRTSPERKQ